MLVWGGIIIGMMVAVSLGLHYTLRVLLDHSLYHNPRYTLNEIDIEPKDKFSTRSIREAAGLEPGENLWTLNLAQIATDLEKTALRFERGRWSGNFPTRSSSASGNGCPSSRSSASTSTSARAKPSTWTATCIVLKPRDNETAPDLPEIIGLTNAELEPGQRLEQPMLEHALEILDAIGHDSALRTSIDIRSIDLSQPLSITMTTTHDLAITFRPDYISQQLARLEAGIDYAESQQKTLHMIDLTPDRNVPLTFYQ